MMPSVRPEIFDKNCTRRPREVSREILSLCAGIVPGVKPIVVSSQPIRSAAAQNCFYNVRRCVDREGGDILYGWAIWEWPRVFIEAEHHAVWKKSETLLDVTPHATGEASILFLPDPARAYDFARDRRLKNRKKSLGEIKSVEAWFQAADRWIEFQERYSTGLTISAPEQEYRAYLMQYLQAQSQVYVDLARLMTQDEACFCHSGRKFGACCSRLITL